MLQESLVQHRKGRGVDRQGEIQTADFRGEKWVQGLDIHHPGSGQAWAIGNLVSTDSDLAGPVAPSLRHGAMRGNPLFLSALAGSDPFHATPVT